MKTKVKSLSDFYISRFAVLVSATVMIAAIAYLFR